MTENYSPLKALKEEYHLENIKKEINYSPKTDLNPNDVSFRNFKDKFGTPIIRKRISHLSRSTR